jgi:hypothetical protein
LQQESGTYRKQRKARADDSWSVSVAEAKGVTMHEDQSSPNNPLQRYVGSWRGEVSVDGRGIEPYSYTQENTWAWTLGGRFLEERGTGSNGSSFLGMWSLDASSGKYRAYYFIAPSADVVVLTHEWNELHRTFSGSAELGGGIRMLAEDRFLDRDRYEWSITIQDSAGQTISRMRGRERRVTDCSESPGD